MPDNNPDVSYFRPPPEASHIFADLVEDENGDEEETMPHPQSSPHEPPQTLLLAQQWWTLTSMGRREPSSQRVRFFNRQLQPRIEAASHESRILQQSPGSSGVVPSSSANSASLDDDEYAFPLPPRGEPASFARVRTAPRIPEFWAFSIQRDRKKATQVERVRESEEALKTFLGEFPEETKFLAKVPQLEKYKQKLIEGAGLLNSSETRWVYEVSRAVERRRVVIETREFEEKAKALIKSAGEKRKRKGAVPSPWSSSQVVVTPAHPSTGGKTIPGYVIDEIDKEDSDEEQDARLCQKAHKTLAGYDGPEISAFDVNKALETESETEEHLTKNDASEHESEDESEKSEEGSRESSSDASSDVDERFKVEAEAVMETGEKAEIEAKVGEDVEAKVEMEGDSEEKAQSESADDTSAEEAEPMDKVGKDVEGELEAEAEAL